MLRSTPTAASSTSSDEPPYETNGSGIPVSGAIPSTAARLTAACPQTSVVTPAASRLPNGSRQRSATRKPAQAKTANAAITTCGADEPELLADDREDHVGVRLGQEVHLLDPLPEPLAGDPARAHADDRLHVLEARALGVLPRVEEAEHALAPVRLHPDREQPSTEGESRRERRTGAARIPETSRMPATIRNSVIVVPRSGSTHDQRRRTRTTTSPTGFISSPIVRGAGRRASTAQAQTQNRELRELGGLDADRAERGTSGARR